MVRLIKNFQLWTHHHYSEIRLWLIILIGLMFFCFSMVSIANQNRLINQVNTLALQNKALSLQNKALNNQSKDLAEQNQSIAKQNRAYTSCIAQIFATFTRDRQPITITNLDSCTTSSQTTATNNTSTGGTSPGGGPASRTTNTSPAPSAPQNKPPAPAPKPLDCKIDLLGFHLGCPS